MLREIKVTTVRIGRHRATRVIMPNGHVVDFPTKLSRRVAIERAREATGY